MNYTVAAQIDISVVILEQVNVIKVSNQGLGISVPNRCQLGLLKMFILEANFNYTVRRSFKEQKINNISVGVLWNWAPRSGSNFVHVSHTIFYLSIFWVWFDLNIMLIHSPRWSGAYYITWVSIKDTVIFLISQPPKCWHSKFELTFQTRNKLWFMQNKVVYCILKAQFPAFAPQCHKNTKHKKNIKEFPESLGSPQICL